MGAHNPNASENGVDVADNPKAILCYMHELHKDLGEDNRSAQYMYLQLSHQHLVPRVLGGEYACPAGDGASFAIHD